MPYGKLVTIAACILGLLTASAEAHTHRHHHHKTHAASLAVGGACVFNNDGRVICNGAPERLGGAPIRERNRQNVQTAGGVSPECRPWLGVTCGCEVSLKVFGRVVHSPNLKQARTWGGVFHHTAPAIGMVAGRSHHVALIIGGGPGHWTLWDPNSGGYQTHVRTSDLSEFSWVVDPHSRQLASLN